MFLQALSHCDGATLLGIGSLVTAFFFSLAMLCRGLAKHGA